MHPQIAARIVRAAGLSKHAVAVEIGPGTGILTRELLKTAKKVIAVELDTRFFIQLKTAFAPEIRKGQLELMHGDIRTFDLSTLPKGYAVIANIPYYITGEIIRMFLEAPRQPASMTLLVQKEVAKRIVGNPERSGGTRSTKESILSLSVKAYGTPKYEFTVPRGAFIPAPSVDSAVLSVAGISRKHFKTAKQERRFFDLLHAGFAHKRKFVRSNVKGLVSDHALHEARVPLQARAEDLKLATWLQLAS